MIQPTVGRVVHFHCSPDFAGTNGLYRQDASPMAAHVAFVHDERMINLCVIDHTGQSHGLTSIQLVQPDDEVPESAHARWMPYQVRKSHGSESGEEHAGTEQI